ncbi:hypothetical protein [Flexithrix dorotheae]|uniref:hypothetical protein n=1 Tax=Flexithrix dorotheae TaxID=70993 RepID=UPI000377F9DD|nr:hypothetical protein [Flexithrix dorotheae]
MKQIVKTLGILFSLLVSTFFTGHAQSNSEEIEFIQSIFGKNKKMIVEEFVQPSEAHSQAFWDLYDEYEIKRKELGKKRLDLLNEYAENYSEINDESAKTWMKEVITLKKSTDKLLDSYFKKMSKATSPVVATQFYQAESYILTMIRYSILDSIPFVGELSK